MKKTARKTAFGRRLGVAFAHEDGKGFNIVLDCFPVDGKIALREPKAKEEGGNG